MQSWGVIKSLRRIIMIAKLVNASPWIQVYSSAARGRVFSGPEATISDGIDSGAFHQLYSLQKKNKKKRFLWPVTCKELNFPKQEAQQQLQE